MTDRPKPTRKIPSTSFAARRAKSSAPKRPIQSRPLTSRATPSQTTSSKSSSGQSSSSNTAPSNSSSGAKPSAAPAKRGINKKRPAPSPSPNEEAQVPAGLPQCLWELGFEAKPTLEELRQRYRELSLVLHPDTRGNKEAFVALRTNYESAQEYLAKQ